MSEEKSKGPLTGKIVTITVKGNHTEMTLMDGMTPHVFRFKGRPTARRLPSGELDLSSVRLEAPITHVDGIPYDTWMKQHTDKN